MTELASLVLFARDAHATAAFYRALGLDLHHEDHGAGPTHFAAELGEVHLAIYQAEQDDGPGPTFRAAANTFPGFYVSSLDRVRGELVSGGARLFSDHQVRPWGCRVVAADPDGRPVEINQRGHCPPDAAGDQAG
ncbi:MAG: hypothetical protein DLM57_14865 [Pseudonocardiales bacterium]|nr:MAG: hypothetical protein DLM57_14865 [Pseudonocardiales bacterium]